MRIPDPPAIDLALPSKVHIWEVGWLKGYRAAKEALAAAAKRASARGGKASMETMTDEQRIERARRANAASLVTRRANAKRKAKTR